ncbi:MAG: hypothetical protein Alis3KO_00740 [Aliiglaciecola sp.]
MKLSRCPICHHSIHLEAMAQDEAASELIKLTAKLAPHEATSCLSYIGLFRPAKSDLNNGRALRLLNDVLSITPNRAALCQALDTTVLQITQNRLSQSDTKPLSNHNYLLKVLKSVPGWDLNVVSQPPGVKHEIAIRSAQSRAQNVDEALLDINDRSWAE